MIVLVFFLSFKENLKIFSDDARKYEARKSKTELVKVLDPLHGQLLPVPVQLFNCKLINNISHNLQM